MGQTTTLRELDADCMDSFMQSGFADSVTVTVPGGSPVPCDAYIDRTRQDSGDQSQVSEPYVQITLQRAQIDDAPIGTVIEVDETGELFQVDKVLPGDESALTCVVIEYAVPEDD